MKEVFGDVIRKTEEQKKILVRIQKGLEQWETYNLDQKHKFIDSIPSDIAILSDTDAKVVITEIVHSGICGKTELKKRVKQAKEALNIIEPEKPIKIPPKIIEEELTPIHPALDFTDNLAFVTIPLMCMIPEVKGGKQENKPKPIYYTITSEKEKFIFTTKELISRGFYSSTQPCILDTRWKYKSIKDYLEGKVSSPDPAKLFNDIKALFNKYMDYRDERLYDYFSYWVIGTYLFPLFSAYPYVFLNGKSETGKSKTMRICEGLSFNAINTANISDASFFRIIEGSRATLLLDEMEKVGDPEQRNNLLSLILAGFIKGAKVIRTEKVYKDQFVPRKFEIHSSKMIANVKGIPIETMKNRCVTFVTSPTRTNKGKLEPDLNDSIWQELRNDLYIFALENWQTIRITKKTIESELKGYAFNRWEAILTLAKFFSNYLKSDESLNNMQDLSLEKTEEREQEKKVSYDIQLLESVIDLVNEDEKRLDYGEKKNKVFYASKDIREKYINDLDIEGNPPDWLTPQKVGRMLNSFDIGKAGRYGIKRSRGIWIDLNALKDVATRFGLEEKISKLEDSF